jgi:hypothetical protein
MMPIQANLPALPKMASGRSAAVSPLRIGLEELRQNLADHMLKVYDAPSPDVAMVAAIHEVEFMQELCEDQDLDTLLAINRVLTDDGVREQYRAIKPQAPNIN